MTERVSSKEAGERFQATLLALAQPIILKRIEAEENGQTYESDAIENLVGELFQHWSEIHSCRTGLNLALSLARRAPSKQLNVKHAEYLKFCVETYFAEIYRLKERLVACGKTFSRKFAVDKKITNEFVTAVEESVKDLANARNEFVHRSRFDDPQIREAEGLELLSAADESSRHAALWGRLAKRRLRNLRKRWADTLQRQNDRIDELLDGFFAVLFRIVFDSSGNLKPSKNSKPNLVATRP